MIRPVFLLCLGVVGFLSGPAVLHAQSVESGQADQARLHLGPLALDPRVAVRNLGVDTNALNQSGSGERDVTATVTPELKSWLRVGRLHLSSTSSVDWNYFQRLTSQRSFNGAQDGRAELSLAHFRPYVTGNVARSRQRPNLEIDARVEHTTSRVGAGVLLQVGPRLTVDIGNERRTLEFGETTLGDISLARSLNRRETETGLLGRFTLTPLTSLVFDARHRQDRFDHAIDRDTDTLAVMGGLEFKPLAFISGRARIGWRRFTPAAASLPDYRGAIADVELSYLLRDLTRFTATVARDTEYSFELTEPYYVSTGTQVSVVQAVGGAWDVVGRAGRTTLAYQRVSLEALEALPADGDLVAVRSRSRVDRLILVGAGVGRRLGTDVRIGLDIDRAMRRSDVAGRAYEGIRVGGSITYGF